MTVRSILRPKLQQKIRCCWRCKQYFPDTNTEAASIAGSGKTADVAFRETKQVKWSMGSFFRKDSIQPFKPALSDREAIKLELKSCLQALEVDGENDPSGLVEMHQVNFPRVSKLAKKYLCIPATNALSQKKEFELHIVFQCLKFAPF
ncbi:hypothetical protein ILYODFUR_026701 [Ilyodon furcidens]|uniref:Uncharacterized protein n=1 Tax=Ilyodon furcidens TaxID=33524 RepID=A0ABV0TXY3_9TELE